MAAKLPIKAAHINTGHTPYITPMRVENPRTRGPKPPKHVCYKHLMLQGGDIPPDGEQIVMRGKAGIGEVSAEQPLIILPYGAIADCCARLHFGNHDKSEIYIFIFKNNLAHNRLAVSTVDSHYALAPDNVSRSDNDATAVGNAMDVLVELDVQCVGDLQDGPGQNARYVLTRRARTPGDAAWRPGHFARVGNGADVVFRAGEGQFLARLPGYRRIRRSLDVDLLLVGIKMDTNGIKS